ncbi:class II aldolase/adducin family protein [Coriobacterium glomerans]|nr:class II aldolase/adducin family protein [Coriobacterium glomerans]
MEQQRTQIVKFGRKMSASGLCVGTSGNISVFDPRTGYLCISPSGLGYFETEPEDIVVMDLAGNVIEGERKPSSEHGLHTIVYLNRPDARAVVHTHSPFATTLASMHETLKPAHYAMMGAAVYEIPLVEYETFGSAELASAVEMALRATPATRALLLANHGDVCLHESLSKAFALAENIEFTSRVQWQCACAGRPVYLTRDQFARALERSRTYGQVPNGR